MRKADVTFFLSPQTNVFPPQSPLVPLQTGGQTSYPGHTATVQPQGCAISAAVSPVAVVPLLHALTHTTSHKNKYTPLVPCGEINFTGSHGELWFPGAPHALCRRRWFLQTI